MKTKRIAVAVALVVSGEAYAGISDKGGIISTPEEDSGWTLGVNANVTLGAKADFSRLGSWASPNTPQPLGGNRDRFYDDGFNRVDATGNGGGATSYWGYENASQYDPSGTGSIDMSIYNGLGTGSADDEAPGFGAEVYGYKKMGALPSFPVEGATWGFRVGVQLSSFSFEDKGTATTSARVLTDTFDLGGAVPPSGPFSGSPSGFGNALLGDTPTRSTSVVNGLQVDGSRELDVVMLAGTGGVYLDLPVTSAFSARVEGGLALALASGKYDLEETVTLPGGSTRTLDEDDREFDIVPGAYIGITGVYQIDSKWSVDAGARYQYYDTMDFSAGQSDAELEFSNAVTIHLGVSYKF